MQLALQGTRKWRKGQLAVESASEAPAYGATHNADSLPQYGMMRCRIPAYTFNRLGSGISAHLADLQECGHLLQLCLQGMEVLGAGLKP
jgi:hypothetical protein